MSTSVELITIENVTKSFDGKLVLKEFSAVLKTGQITGLIGRSGSGKSVLLQMLRGNNEYKPDTGRVIYHVNRCPKCGNLDIPFEGQPCTKCGEKSEHLDVDFWALSEYDSLKTEIRSRVAIMLQRTFALWGDKSVIENILDAIDEKTPHRIEKAIELLEFVNMSHRTMHIARDLSGGEKQRIVIARQLAKNPLFFIADEPTGTLDPYTADVIHKKLVEYVRSHNICMMFASHWPEALEKMADDAYWFENGAVKMSGEPKPITVKFMEGYSFDRSEIDNMGTQIVRLENAEKHFYSVSRGVVKAVDGVTFDINERECFALVGYSGAGKTTTSQMICGLSNATKGKVEVRIGDTWVDMSKDGYENKGRATPYIGILHQEYALYPFNTVLQNLTTSIGINMPAELARMKAAQVLMSVGFEKKDINRVMESYPDTLSVGECQRIAFAQVLIKEPRIVVLDEPTGTMDPLTKIIVAKSVLRARETLGETFIVVSHDMDFIKNCCDRAAFMKAGKVIGIGDPEEMIAKFDTPEESKE